MFSAPWYQPVNGGISHTASSREHRHDRADVLVPERLHVPVQQRALLRGRRARRRCPRPGAHVVELGAGPLQGAVDGGGRGLRAASATSAARQRSTSRRMSTARCRGGRCCSAAMNASRMLSRPATIVAGSLPSAATRESGIGSSHGTSPRSTSGSPGCELGAPSPVGSGRRARPSRADQARVRRDPVEPGAQRGPALEAVVRPPRAQVRLLHEVLGVVDRSEHPVAVREQLAPVGVGQLREAVG